MSHSHGRCPFCQTEVRPDEEVFLCPGCEVPYHVECFSENQGCAVFGCLYKPGSNRARQALLEALGQSSATPVGRVRCPFCARLIERGEQTFECPECGVSHHVQCWYANDGCAINGCRSAPGPEPWSGLWPVLPSAGDMLHFLANFLLFVVWLLLVMGAVGQFVYVVGYFLTYPEPAGVARSVCLLAGLVGGAVALYRYLPRRGGPLGWLPRPPGG